ncbi:sulfite exporter TauE/SafE family protein [Salinisphaera sp. T31B1]|uniref:sulfite exporter TauE/SafE family protein n=1 Tax=Salinisphaera sp. T31B1 TaxID=727963 RepID=UPI00333EF513
MDVAGLSPVSATMLVALVLLLAATVKGTIGMGLPVVSIALLGSFLDPHQMLALMVAPVIVSNFWQAVSSGYIRTAWRNFWPLILCFCVATAVGGWLMASIDPSVLLLILGVIAIGFAIVNVLKPTLRLRPRDRGWAGLVVGSSAGVLNGLSTVNGPPLLMYLVACDLDKDQFVGAYGLIALAGSIPLAMSYMATGVLGATELIWSCAALLPVFAGLTIGRIVRGYIDAVLFRRILLGVLVVLGINLIRRGIHG